MAIDFQRGAKVAGSKFYFLTGDDAWHEWCALTDMIQYHITRGYTFVIPPYMVNHDCATWAGNLPRFQDQFYEIPKDNLIAIPTAETPLVGMHADELFRKPAEQLPIKYVAFSPCFRREAGAAGSRDKGLKRVHQFHKIELFMICTADQSEQLHQEMVDHVCKMIDTMYGWLTYRRIELSADDRSPFSNRTIDIELQVGDEWLEVSSISNMGNNQSKLAQIRYKDENKKSVKCHLINGSALAMPRLTLALNQ